MDFKSMLNQLSQLSEATKETEKGRVHKAEPGGYGRKFDTDEEGEEKKEKKAEGPKKRGRPPATGEHSKEEQKKSKERDEAGKRLQSAIVGNKPKDFDKKKGNVVKGKAQSGDSKKKKSVKEWVEEIEQKYIAEAVPPGMKPLAILDPKNQQAGAGVLTSPNPAIQKMLGSIDPKDVKIVQTQQGQSTTTQPTSATAMKEEGGEKWIQKAVKHPGAFTKKAKAAGQSVAAFAKAKANAPGTLGKQARLAQTLSKMHEGEIPHESGVDNIGAGLGAGRSQTTLENKQKVNESMHKHSAARLMGKAHALAKEGYNCKYEDVEEAKCYHEGYKEGLDECYGQEPIVGLVKENPMPATVPGMASNAMPSMPAMEDEMEEGNLFTGNLAKARAAGKKFADLDNDGDMEKVTEFAFEAWEKELNSLLTESEEVTEGMTVSISKGQQGAPDSVSVSAQDAEADALLGLIKQAGLGLFGDDSNNMPAGNDSLMQKQGGIDVVGDHDGMMALIKKVAGGEEGSDDYKDEEGHDDHEHSDEETCNECGYMESKCACDKEMVDEVESEDQMAYEVAEDNAPDSGAAETTADENAEAAEDEALAKADELGEGEQLDELSPDLLKRAAMKARDQAKNIRQQFVDKDTGKMPPEPTQAYDAKSDQSGRFYRGYEKAYDRDKARAQQAQIAAAGELSPAFKRKMAMQQQPVSDQEQMNEWANQAGKGPGKGTDASFEQDIEFMTKFIAGGLNKPKSTGQTTIPVIAGQDTRMEDPMAWARLAGIKK